MMMGWDGMGLTIAENNLHVLFPRTPTYTEKKVLGIGSILIRTEELGQRKEKIQKKSEN